MEQDNILYHLTSLHHKVSLLSQRISLLTSLYLIVEPKLSENLELCVGDYVVPFEEVLNQGIKGEMDLDRRLTGGWYSFFNIANVAVDQVHQIVEGLPKDVEDHDQVHKVVLRKLSIFSAGGELMKKARHLKTLGSLLENLVVITFNEFDEDDVEDFIETEGIKVTPFWYSYTSDLKRVMKLIDAFKISFMSPDSPLERIWQAGVSIFSSHYREKYTLTTLKEANIDYLKSFWTKPDNNKLIQMVLPTIKSNRNIYIRVGDGKVIRVKVLYTGHLPFTVEGHEKPSILSVDNDLVDVPVLLHIHGGGFISGSPESYETYSRDWAIRSNAITFSIDYTLSPEAKFPEALDQCYMLYNLILNGTFGINPTKIVVGGDSAGGNLAISVAFKCILENQRKPDGLMLIYPVLDMTKTINSSRMLFSLDSLVPYYFLLVCLESYLDDISLSYNPLCSPCKMDDDVLIQLNGIQMCIVNAGLDPLLDDGFDFSRRLKELGVEHTYLLYDFLPHGFLNMQSLLRDKSPFEEITANLVSLFGEIPVS
eukprot:TRINITY_DN13291_c0_g1_i1.p1 TRINITY_DN13291_c0_g1~~TRINITY_DN13291_c0_g1_i1.p1  ORF type:complete len:538 (+),score=104.36 TRINITY_DN13291_c0_g1_i1:6-1619(+)